MLIVYIHVSMLPECFDTISAPFTQIKFSVLHYSSGCFLHYSDWTHLELHWILIASFKCLCSLYLSLQVLRHYINFITLHYRNRLQCYSKCLMSRCRWAAFIWISIAFFYFDRWTCVIQQFLPATLASIFDLQDFILPRSVTTNVLYIIKRRKFAKKI